MAENVRALVVELLAPELGPGIERYDREDGWLTAHLALRTLAWALDAAGLGPEDGRVAELWQRLDGTEGVDALADAHRRYDAASDRDEDLAWPPSVETYVSFVESALRADLAALPVESERPALIRFGAPADDDAVRGIEAVADRVSRHEPRGWLIQRCVGRGPRDPRLTPEIDRFVSHWSYRREYPRPWVELRREEAVRHVVALQRTSLVWSAPPPGIPTARRARERAEAFLACFGDDTRYFTNGDGHRSAHLVDGTFRIALDAMFDTGIVAIDRRYAGLWWHAEGDRHVPLGWSP